MLCSAFSLIHPACSSQQDTLTYFARPDTRSAPYKRLNGLGEDWMAAFKTPTRALRGASAAASARLKLCIGAGLFTVILLWLITPSSGKLYRPSDIQNPIAVENQDLEIINSVIIPSYNEGPNMAPLWVTSISSCRSL